MNGRDSLGEKSRMAHATTPKVDFDAAATLPLTLQCVLLDLQGSALKHHGHDPSHHTKIELSEEELAKHDRDIHDHHLGNFAESSQVSVS